MRLSMKRHRVFKRWHIRICGISWREFVRLLLMRCLHDTRLFIALEGQIISHEGKLIKTKIGIDRLVLRGQIAKQAKDHISTVWAGNDLKLRVISETLHHLLEPLRKLLTQKCRLFFHRLSPLPRFFKGLCFIIFFSRLDSECRLLLSGYFVQLFLFRFLYLKATLYTFSTTASWSFALAWVILASREMRLSACSTLIALTSTG